jgi:hypothetical protein
MLCSPELTLRKYWAFHKQTPPAAGIAAPDQHYREQRAGRFQSVASLADDCQTPPVSLRSLEWGFKVATVGPSASSQETTQRCIQSSRSFLSSAARTNGLPRKTLRRCRRPLRYSPSSWLLRSCVSKVIRRPANVNQKSDSLGLAEWCRCRHARLPPSVNHLGGLE